jgi:aryl carrier-like protein
VTDAPMTREGLVDTVARVAEVPPGAIRDDTNLSTLGLDSLSMMRLVNELRVHGLPVTFDDLAGEPTFGAWWARIAGILAANPYLAA